ncbi:MAG: FAD-binding protein [Calditrichaceae bacterium]
MHDLAINLEKAGITCREDEPLSSYTTFRIGGPAKLFASAGSSDQLHLIIEQAKNHKIPFLVLGKGSNILVSDKGFDGLAIFNNATSWRILESVQESQQKQVNIKQRFDRLEKSVFSEPADKNDEKILIEVESGSVIGVLMKQLFKQNIYGLEWFSGIPSTVGGAIYMNMHGADHFFGELLHSAVLSDGKTIKTVDRDYFQFDYDWSILHKTKEVVLKANLILNKGNTDKAKEEAKNWARYKANQPWKSAGCIFQNLTEEQKIDAQLPSVSIGYLVDKILNLKGERRGDAIISQSHAAFIENVGEATAQDVWELINLIKETTKMKFGIDLKLEVQLVGEF